MNEFWMQVAQVTKALIMDVASCVQVSPVRLRVGLSVWKICGKSEMLRVLILSNLSEKII